MSLVTAIGGGQILVDTVGYVQGMLALGKLKYVWAMVDGMNMNTLMIGSTHMPIHRIGCSDHIAIGMQMPISGKCDHSWGVRSSVPCAVASWLSKDSVTITAALEEDAMINPNSSVPAGVSCWRKRGKRGANPPLSRNCS